MSEEKEVKAEVETVKPEPILGPTGHDMTNATCEFLCRVYCKEDKTYHNAWVTSSGQIVAWVVANDGTQKKNGKLSPKVSGRTSSGTGQPEATEA